MSEESVAPTTSGAGEPAERIAAGHAVEGPAVPLGSVVHDGRRHQGAGVRVGPLLLSKVLGLTSGDVPERWERRVG